MIKTKPSLWSHWPSFPELLVYFLWLWSSQVLGFGGTWRPTEGQPWQAEEIRSCSDLWWAALRAGLVLPDPWGEDKHLQRGAFQSDSSSERGCINKRVQNCLARLSKGFVCFRKTRGKTREKDIPDLQQGRRWEELQVVVEFRNGYLLLWKRPCAIKSCVPSAGWLSQGFYEFCDDSLVCGNLSSCRAVFSVYILWVLLYSSKSLQSW